MTARITALTPLVSTISAGLDKEGYYHELFLRGKQFLTRRIQKGTNPSKRTSSKLPFFYALPFLPESKPKSVPQAVVQSTCRMQVRSFEESTDRQLFLQRNTSHRYVETQEHPRISSNVPVITPTFAHSSLWDGSIRTHQPAPSMSRLASSTQYPPLLQLRLEELGRVSSTMNNI
jgi:hypothetical protein